VLGPRLGSELGSMVTVGLVVGDALGLVLGTVLNPKSSFASSPAPDIVKASLKLLIVQNKPRGQKQTM
jgi:hypothetical protein